MKLPFGINWPNGSDEVWPYVSNIADLWLIIGIGMLLVLLWRAPSEPETAANADSSDNTGSAGVSKGTSKPTKASASE